METAADSGDVRSYARTLPLKWLLSGVHEPPPWRISFGFCASASCNDAIPALAKGPERLVGDPPIFWDANSYLLQGPIEYGLPRTCWIRKTSKCSMAPSDLYHKS